MNPTNHKRAISNNYFPLSSLNTKIQKTPISNQLNNLSKAIDSKLRSLTPPKGVKNNVVPGSSTSRQGNLLSRSKDKNYTNRVIINNPTASNLNSLNKMKPIVKLEKERPFTKLKDRSSLYNQSPVLNKSKSRPISKDSKNLSKSKEKTTKSPVNDKSKLNGYKMSTPKNLLEKLSKLTNNNKSRMITNLDTNSNANTNSFDRSNYSSSPISDGRIRVTRLKSPKYDNNEKLVSKPYMSNVDNKSTEKLNVKPMKVESKSPIKPKKNSLLTKYEDLKNKNALENGSKKFGARGTIEVRNPELFIKSLNDQMENKNIHKEVTSNEKKIQSSLIKKIENDQEIDFPKQIEPKKIKKSIKFMYEDSKIGFSGAGVKKVNQDNLFIHKNFNNNPDNIFMSVCDGHGMYGHEVSLFLKEKLPFNLNKELISKKINLSNNNLNRVIEDVFISTNNKLINDTSIDSKFSGSTCVSVIYSPEKLICANVGDSRAVLGRCVDGIWTSHNLSRDHKPNDKDEAARVKRRGGRIEPYKDEFNEFVGPERVWLKNEDITGLAMTRSFGDKVAASVGIIAEPEITHWNFTNEDKFLILASDGIWEFIDSEECINIIKDFYLRNEIKEACQYLIKESSRRWLNEEEVIDDTTLILLFFQ